jgi:hypothetical protein
MLGSLYPGHEKEIAAIIAQIRAIMGYMDVLYGIDNPLFLDNFKDLRYVVSTLLPWLLKYRRCMPMIEKLNEPVDSYLRRFRGRRPSSPSVTSGCTWTTSIRRGERDRSPAPLRGISRNMAVKSGPPPESPHSMSTDTSS